MYAVFGHSAELHMISWTKATTLLLIWGTWKTWKTSQSGSDYWSEALGYASCTSSSLDMHIHVEGTLWLMLTMTVVRWTIRSLSVVLNVWTCCSRSPPVYNTGGSSKEAIY